MITKNEDGNFTGHKTSLSAGTRAPFFEAKDQNGSTVKLSDFQGRHLVLYFYPKDDTPTCTNQACNLRDEYQYLQQKNYSVLGVSADDERSHAKFSKKFNLPFQLLADTDMSIIKAYDVWGTKQLFGRILDGIVRTTFIIDPEGMIERVISDVNSKHHARQILSE
jgi:thioredoxin-dependent peroxiredoxin